MAKYGNNNIVIWSHWRSPRDRGAKQPLINPSLDKRIERFETVAASFKIYYY